MQRWLLPGAGGALLVACLIVGWQNNRALDEMRSLVGAQQARLEALAATQQRELGAIAALQLTLQRLGDRNIATAPALAIATAPASPSEPTEPQPTAEATAAAGAAHQLIDAALSRGRWTIEDKAALLQKGALMPAAAFQAEMQKLVLAINAGKIRLDDPRAF